MRQRPQYQSPEESLLLVVAARGASRVEPPTDRFRRAIWMDAKRCSDWDRFVRLAGRQRLLAQAYKFAEDYGLTTFIPRDARRQMEVAYRLAQAMHLCQTRELISVVEKLAEGGIQPIVLKGIPLARSLYTDPAVRASRDIDLLCHPDELDRVDEILINSGYARHNGRLTHEEYRRYHYHVVYGQGEHRDRVVEVHWNVRQPFKGPVIDMESFRATAKTVDIDGTPVRAPDAVHALWHLGVNLSYALFLELRDLGDVRRLALGLDENGWRDLLTHSIRLDTYNEVTTSLAVAEVAFGPFVPEAHRPSRPRFWLSKMVAQAYSPKAIAWRWAPFPSTLELASCFLLRQGIRRKLAYLARFVVPDRASIMETRCNRPVPQSLLGRVGFCLNGVWMLTKILGLACLLPLLKTSISLGNRWLDPARNVTFSDTRDSV